MSTVVTRFAPSPTGLLHAGNYRTAVFAYLFAKHNNGKFILRIEDTDKARSKAEYENNILEALSWMGLDHDAFYRQSENAKRHTELLSKLIEEGKAYISQEPSKDDPEKVMELVRFKNPGGTISFTDIIRGEISIDVSDLKDFIIARSLTEPVFHFAVVVDDADEGVTHIIRGEDHISNTPRHILIREALGFAQPSYAHLPLILSTDRTKLSKRKGAKAITEYRDMGFLPAAVLNYLSYLGWNPGDDTEYLSKEQLVAVFDLSRVQKGGAVFDETKFLSVNQHWMRTLDTDAFLNELAAPNTFDSEKLMKIVPLLKDRAQTFGEAREMLTGELSTIFETPKIDKTTLLAKNPSESPNVAKTALEVLLEPLEAFPEDVSIETVKETLMPYAERNPKETGGRGAILWPLRYALSGKERSPDPFTLIAVLGKQESAARIRAALAIL